MNSKDKKCLHYNIVTPINSYWVYMSTVQQQIKYDYSYTFKQQNSECSISYNHRQLKKRTIARFNGCYVYILIFDIADYQCFHQMAVWTL